MNAMLDQSLENMQFVRKIDCFCRSNENPMTSNVIPAVGNEMSSAHVKQRERQLTQWKLEWIETVSECVALTNQALRKETNVLRTNDATRSWNAIS